jgi:hypothetical protein
VFATSDILFAGRKAQARTGDQALRLLSMVAGSGRTGEKGAAKVEPGKNFCMCAGDQALSLVSMVTSLGSKSELGAAKVAPRRTPTIDGQLEFACLGMFCELRGTTEFPQWVLVWLTLAFWAPSLLDILQFTTKCKASFKAVHLTSSFLY